MASRLQAVTEFANRLHHSLKNDNLINTYACQIAFESIKMKMMAIITPVLEIDAFKCAKSFHKSVI